MNGLNQMDPLRERDLPQPERMLAQILAEDDAVARPARRWVPVLVAAASALILGGGMYGVTQRAMAPAPAGSPGVHSTPSPSPTPVASGPIPVVLPSVQDEPAGTRGGARPARPVPVLVPTPTPMPTAAPTPGGTATPVASPGPTRSATRAPGPTTSVPVVVRTPATMPPPTRPVPGPTMRATG